MAENKKNNSKSVSAVSRSGKKENNAGTKTSSAGKNSNPASGSSRKTGQGKKEKGKKTAEAGKQPKKNPAGSRMRDEIVAVLMVAFGIFLLVSLMTEATGEFGNILGLVLKGLFGVVAYILPFFLIVYALLILMNHMAHVNSRSVFFSVLLYADMSMLNAVRFIKQGTSQPWMNFFKDSFYNGYVLKSGGIVGMLLGRLTAACIGRTGIVIAGIAVAVICAIIIADTPVSVFLDGIREKRNNKLAERQKAYEEQEYESDEYPEEALPDKSSVKSSGAALTADFEDNGSSIFTRLFGKGSGNGRSDEVYPVKTDDADARGVQNTSAATGYNNGNETRSVFDNGYLLEKTEKQDSPFANLRIKGASLFKGSTAERDLFSDLPENQRRIMNYMSDDEIFGGGSADGIYYPDDDELNNYKAADFFYEIKNIPDMNDAGKNVIEADAEIETEPQTGTQLEIKETDSFDEWLDENISGSAENNSSYIEQTDSVAYQKKAASHQKSAEHLQSQNQGTAIQQQQQMTRGQMRAAAEMGAADISASLQNAQQTQKKEYKLPPISLLHASERKINRNEQKELALKAARLEQVLHDFGVNARVIDVKKGPSVTRYEIQPATGVKVNSITKLADDIALNLEAKSLRIEAPIPGKAAVGIEVENDSSSTVTMREMVESPEFENSKSKISFVVGEDISGNHVVADLKGMPHLLIAGSTGSGKSVCINSLIISMIYKSTPDEVKFILIDPKVVELGNYNGIPHMLIPVVTDPSKAAAALAWAVQEMNDRYKKFAETSVRKLEEYNKKMEKEGRTENVLPQIVIIIDELADLMMAASKQVEESICRLAQLARAAGMHLVVATQRPSVDVVTGLIKANIPSRIAFAVSSQVDSRTILDRAGAEKLVGKGDMLFYPLGKAQPERLQGPFVTDDEVEAVIDFWKTQSDGNDEAGKIMAAINTVMPEVSADGDEDEDELLPEAIELVVTSGQASASMLQRRYRIGYNRAGRIIDIMEDRGIIGPSEGSKPRKVLMSKEEYAQQQSSSGRNADVQAEQNVMPATPEAMQSDVSAPAGMFSDDYGTTELSYDSYDEEY